MKRYPSCLLAARCVPWDEQGRFAEAIFRRGVRATLAHGTNHLYIFGTAGEGYAVTDTQFDQVATAFAEEMHRAGAEPMVGVIGLSLGTMLERIERCRALGVREFQFSLPNWGALRDGEMFDCFDRICRRFPESRFLHYNLPRARRIVSGKEYGRLAEEHPNLVATKNTGDSLSHIQSLLEDAPQLQHFLSERGFVVGSLFGECGILASLIMNWSKLQALWEAGKRRDIATLASLSRECNLVLRTLFETVAEGRIDGAYDKVFEKMHDPKFPLRLLPPYEGASEEEYRAFVKLLAERLPEWVPNQNSER